MPPLLTRISIFPKCAITALVTALIESSLARSISNGCRVAASRLNLRGDFCQFGCVASGERDVCSGRGKRQRAGAANALRCAGDQSNPAIQRNHAIHSLGFNICG